MSWQAVRWVMAHSEAAHGDRLVLLAIAEHADAEGRNAYPSQPTIARESRLSERQVRRAVQRLRALGELDWEARAVKVRLPGGQVVGVHRYRLPKMGNTDRTYRPVGADTDRTSGETDRTSAPDRPDILFRKNLPEPPLQTRSRAGYAESQEQDPARLSYRQWLQAQGFPSTREALAARRAEWHGEKAQRSEDPAPPDASSGSGGT